MGEKLQLNAIATDGEDGEILAAMTYKSKNSKIAKVSADGTVQGVKKGKTTITVTTTGGAAETVTITVVAAPTKVTLKPSSAKLSIGEQKTLEAAIPSGQSGHRDVHGEARGYRGGRRKRRCDGQGGRHGDDYRGDP